MSRIEGNVTDLTPRAQKGVAAGGLYTCWMCQTGVSARAAFCHECGTVQAVRPLSHFERLGFDSRFDIDCAVLDARHAAQVRIFQSRRFASRGPRQAQLAGDHLQVLNEAFAVLRDPVRRAEYLLVLLQDGGASIPEIRLDDVDALKGELHQAADTAAIDRVANEASRGVETCIRDLSAAFRQHAFTDVWGILARLSQLENVARDARTRRGEV